MESDKTYFIVDIVLPEFYPERESPAIWLFCVEEMLESVGITDEETKYRLVGKHEGRWKEYAIKDVRMTMRIRAKGLLKPSQFLDRLYAETAHFLDDEQIRQLWLSRLPETEQRELEHLGNMPVEKLLRKVVDYERTVGYPTRIRSVITRMTCISIVEFEIVTRSVVNAMQRSTENCMNDQSENQMSTKGNNFAKFLKFLSFPRFAMGHNFKFRKARKRGDVKRKIQAKLFVQ